MFSTQKNNKKEKKRPNQVLEQSPNRREKNTVHHVGLTMGPYLGIELYIIFLLMNNNDTHNVQFLPFLEYIFLLYSENKLFKRNVILHLKTSKSSSKYQL